MTGARRAPAAEARRIVDFLVERGRLDQVQRDRVTALRRERGESECVILTRLGIVGEREMAECLSEFLAIPLARPSDYPDAPVGPRDLGAEFIARSQALPLRDTAAGLVLAMADPTDDYTIKAVRLAAGKPVQPCVAVPSELTAALERLYGTGTRQPTRLNIPVEAAREDVRRLSDSASEEPVIRYVNALIGQAAAVRASDIHIEASADRIIQRLRVDGLLRDIAPPPAGLHDNIISRLKIMASLNIAERRLPQDGRFRVVVEGREIDLRVSIVPTLHGESVVMRLLDREHAPLDLGDLGFGGDLRRRLDELLALPSGMLLVTGPTGSGKTSTLYAALQLLNTRERKILTVEDPVEYQLPGINQIPVRAAIGLTFANVLRSLLRQDPDILLVGEIRDVETVRIGAQAALTGHLLLSTLHTNDAVGSIVRLIDMGLEDYLVAAVLKGVLAQRLVRCLCPACRTPYEPEAKLLDHPELAPLAGTTLFRAAGCDACAGTGYRGCTAIAELLAFDENMARLVVAGTDAATLARTARERGMTDLRHDGIAKVAAGITSLDEVLRVTGVGVVPRFHYRALRPSGVEIAGELVAEDEGEAISQLQAVGNYPIEITVPAARPRLHRAPVAARGQRLPPGELILFTRQLATLIGAGVPLDRALSLIGAGPTRQRRTRLALDLLDAVNRGESLSRACSERSGLPSHYAMVIAAGEARGAIGEAIERLATVLERSRAASRALLGALIYPISVFVVACISVSFLMLFVVPRFETLLASLQHEPPVAMRILLLISAAFEQAALPLLVVVLAVAGLIAVRWRDPRFRPGLDRRLLSLPLLGPFLRKAEAERLVFLLGNLVGAGVTLPAAIAATAAATTHLSVREALVAAEQGILRGDGLTASLAVGGLLPDMASELVRIGEETGDLAVMLLKASDLLQREIEAGSAALITLVTPVSTILLGLLIGGIAFALLGTILQVYDVAG